MCRARFHGDERARSGDRRRADARSRVGGRPPARPGRPPPPRHGAIDAGSSTPVSTRRSSGSRRAARRRRPAPSRGREGSAPRRRPGPRLTRRLSRPASSRTDTERERECRALDEGLFDRIAVEDDRWRRGWSPRTGPRTAAGTLERLQPERIPLLLAITKRDSAAP